MRGSSSKATFARACRTFRTTLWLFAATLVIATLAGSGVASGSTAADGSADVGVVLAALPPNVSPGQLLNFQPTITNAGPDDATGVQLSETVPEGLTIVETDPSQGECGQDGNLVTCDMGTISSGGSGSVDVVVRTPGSFKALVAKAHVSADQSDPNGDNNDGKATARSCTRDCTGAWFDDGGTVAGPKIRHYVTQSATLTAPTGVHGPVSSQNLTESPCQEPPDFETYGQVFDVNGPEATEGRVYKNKFTLITSKDTSVGVPPGEPLGKVTLERSCVVLPRCLSRAQDIKSIPPGFQGCVYRVFRDPYNKNVTIGELDTGQDPPIRGGG
jgi:uncharacterized repeat protein (TIGR01451 family)